MAKKKKKNKVSNKIPFVRTTKFKLVGTVFLGILISVIVTLGIAVPRVKSSIKGTIESYMSDVVTIEGESIDRDIKNGDSAYVLEPSNLEKAVGDIRIHGMESSYAYVVSSQGKMLYHPTPEKIGHLVENAVVTQLVEDLKAGIRPETKTVGYEFKGAIKYASYYVADNMSYILVISADESEVFAELDSVVQATVLGAVFAIIVNTIFAVFLVFRTMKPLDKITAIIEKCANMDFRATEGHEVIEKRKDEIGLMARSIEVLRLALVNVAKKIGEQSTELYDASQVLSRNASETVTTTEQVEKAISEIAEGATSQASETQEATENVILMGNMLEENGEEVERLRNNAKLMSDAGEKAMAIITKLSAVNQKTKEAIDIIVSQTNSTNKSVMQIKEAINIITNIAEETNLLALNASIEAARAGEHGRGFAVVAAQIQKLAEQSNESAVQIEEIVNILIGESEKSVETMDEVKVVIEKQDDNVHETQQAFNNVKSGIDSSIDSIQAIAERTAKLDEARIRVVDVVQNLTAIAEENAASTEETSASASEVGAIMNDVADNVENLNAIANGLDESMKMFIVE